MKTKLKIIDVESSGEKIWYGGAFSHMFVYSKYHGNFILRGYIKEIEEFLKKKLHSLFLQSEFLS